MARARRSPTPKAANSNSDVFVLRRRGILAGPPRLFHSKLFVANVVRFGNAIGINYEDIARLKFRAAFTEVRVSHDSERQSAGGKLFHGAAGMNDERWIVPRVQEREPAIPRIELSIEQRDETVRRDVGMQVRIKCGDET